MTTNENITTEDTEIQPAGGEQPSGPAELRAALDREKAARKALEAKLADQAFKEAGFAEGTKERKALDKFFDGDRTDPGAIKAFAEEYGLTGSTPGAQITHVDPAPTVVADARSAQLDAAAVDISGDESSERAKRAKALLVESLKPGAPNKEMVEAAIASELEAAGFPPINLNP